MYMSTNTQTQSKKVQRRGFEGVVVLKSGDKTVRVMVLRSMFNAKYHKHYTRRNYFLVHDEKNQYNVGDKVHFMECRPLSKTKRWRVLYS